MGVVVEDEEARGIPGMSDTNHDHETNEDDDKIEDNEENGKHEGRRLRAQPHAAAQLASRLPSHRLPSHRLRYATHDTSTHTFI